MAARLTIWGLTILAFASGPIGWILWFFLKGPQLLARSFDIDG